MIWNQVIKGSRRWKLRLKKKNSLSVGLLPSWGWMFWSADSWIRRQKGGNEKINNFDLSLKVLKHPNVVCYHLYKYFTGAEISTDASENPASHNPAGGFPKPGRNACFLTPSPHLNSTCQPSLDGVSPCLLISSAVMLTGRVLCPVSKGTFKPLWKPFSLWACLTLLESKFHNNRMKPTLGPLWVIFNFRKPQPCTSFPVAPPHPTVALSCVVWPPSGLVFDGVLGLKTQHQVRPSSESPLTLWKYPPSHSCYGASSTPVLSGQSKLYCENLFKSPKSSETSISLSCLLQWVFYVNCELGKHKREKLKRNMYIL